MALVWPPGLPQAPLLGSYTKRLPKLTIRSSVDAGFDKVRRRFTAAPVLHDMSLKLTRSQVAIFRTFFLDTTQGGALPFGWKDHETGDACDFRFVDEPKLRPLAPRQGGSEYWETEVFTLEQLPAEDSDTGGDPPADPYGGFFQFDFDSESGPAAEQESLSLAPPIAEPIAPTEGYYPWLLEPVGETAGNAQGDELTFAQLYGETADTCGSASGSNPDTGTGSQSSFMSSGSSSKSIGSVGIGGFVDC